MSRRTRALVAMSPGGDPVQLAERYRHRLARHQHALAWSEDEVAQFLAVASAFDHSSAHEIAAQARQSGIRIPVRLDQDAYRLGRFLLRRWPDATVRQRLLETINLDRQSPAARDAQQGDLAAFANGPEAYHWPLIGTWVLRHVGRADLVPAFKAALSRERLDWYQANLAYGRYLMHRYINESDEAERQPTAGEQRDIIRRMRRRELQLRSMRHNLYALSQERKALVGRVRTLDQTARAELTALLARLDEIQTMAAAAEREHAAAMSARTEEYKRRIAALEAEIAATAADFAAALVERNRWAPVAMLDGLTVAIVGDDGREAGYRALVESAGGRLIHVSALEKLRRIPDAVAAANVIIVMTAIAKHQAEHRLRKTAAPGALILRCPKAGLGAFERLMRTELLPRLAVSQLAPTRHPGGESHA